MSEHCVCTACDRGWLPVFATMALSFAVELTWSRTKLFFDGELDAGVEAVRDYVRSLGVIFDIILVGQ